MSQQGENNTRHYDESEGYFGSASESSWYWRWKCRRIDRHSNTHLCNRSENKEAVETQGGKTTNQVYLMTFEKMTTNY